MRSTDAHSGYHLPFHPLRLFYPVYGGALAHGSCAMPQGVAGWFVRWTRILWNQDKHPSTPPPFPQLADFHHSLKGRNQNFGSFAIWDWLCGTDRKYRRYLRERSTAAAAAAGPDGKQE